MTASFLVLGTLGVICAAVAAFLWFRLASMKLEGTTIPGRVMARLLGWATMLTGSALVFAGAAVVVWLVG